MKLSALTIYKTKPQAVPQPVVTFTTELTQIDQELNKIRRGRKELRYLATQLLKRRQYILEHLPPELRPKPGRPKKK